MGKTPTKTVEEICERLIDYRGKTPTKTESGVKLITAKVIKGGGIEGSDHEYIAEEDFDVWMRRGLPKAGDVLVTTEAPLGEVAPVPADERIALAQRVILLRANPSICDPAYLLYAFQSPQVQWGLNSRASGCTVTGIKNSELRKVLIPLPALSQQKSIGEVLSAYDDLIENNRRRISLLEESARLLYREWFVRLRFPGHEHTRIVNGVPEGWKYVPATEAIEVNPRTKLSDEEEHWYVEMSDLPTDSMVIQNAVMRDGRSGSKFMNGDTLFARITPCLENGKTGFVNFMADGEAGRGSTEFIVLRSKLVTPEFVYCLARTYDFREHAIKNMVGSSGRQRVKESCFEKFMLMVPTHSLLDLFSDFTLPVCDQIKNLHRQNQKLRTARDLLLPKLMSGEIEV